MFITNNILESITKYNITLQYHFSTICEHFRENEIGR